jgi:polyisoprenoid-binding protein YceI
MIAAGPRPPAPGRNSAPVNRHRRHRWLRWTVGVLGTILVVVVGGLAIDAHLTTAPAPLALPKVAGANSSGSTASTSFQGVWSAGPGSIVGFRADQVLAGQQSTLVGRTGKVWGSLTIAGGTVSRGSFTVDMAALTDGESQTTQRTVFDVTADPTATLVLTSPIALGTVPADGTVRRFAAAGTLTFHGVSRMVEFTVSAERTGAGFDALADITLPLGEWNISIQGVPFLADIQSPAVVEVLLEMTQGEGNQPSVAQVGG